MDYTHTMFVYLLLVFYIFRIDNIQSQTNLYFKHQRSTKGKMQASKVRFYLDNLLKALKESDLPFYLFFHVTTS